MLVVRTLDAIVRERAGRRTSRAAELRRCLVRQWYAHGKPDAPPFVVEVMRMRGATAMRKRLVKHGNSRALVIDKALLEVLNLSDDDEVQVSINGDQLIITPVRGDDERQKRFEQAVERTMEQYDDLFRRLAE
jgi:antitoxin MazE